MGVSMARADSSFGVSAIAPMPAFGRGGAQAERASGRVPLLESLVVALLILVVVPPLILTARKEVRAGHSLVQLSLSSDPEGASVIIDDLWVGRTPLQLDVERGQEFSFRVEAREPYLEYHLYKPYRSRLSLEENRNLHVWIPRTTAAEQAAQLEALP
jgi:hypothetical protein